MTALIKKTTWPDVFHVADFMRMSDRREVIASTGQDHKKVLMQSVLMSDRDMTWTIFYSGEPVAVFGVAPGEYGGIPWLLATDRFSNENNDFVKSFPWAYIEMMKRVYGNLYNYVHEKNRRSITWLVKCGFIVGDAVPFGMRGEMFRFFETGVSYV